jgi:hypothetical protein
MVAGAALAIDAIAARIAAAPSVFAVRVISLSLAETGADKKHLPIHSAVNKPSGWHPVPRIETIAVNCCGAVTGFVA